MALTSAKVVYCGRSSHKAATKFSQVHKLEFKPFISER